MKVEGGRYAARVHVFEVPSISPSGLQPGCYCVWVWNSGEAELMFRPEGFTHFMPPTPLTRTETQESP